MIPQAIERGHYPIGKSLVSAKTEVFASGAVEAAVRLLAIFAPVNAEKVIILLTDGRDGYLEARSIFLKGLEKRCGVEKNKSKNRHHRHKGMRVVNLSSVLNCILQGVGSAERPRYRVRVRYLEYLITLMQALGIRGYVVAYPDTLRPDKQLLGILADKTGGTFRIGKGDITDFIRKITQAVRELSEEGVVVVKQKMEEDHWYEVTATAIRGNRSKELTNKHPYWVFVPPGKNFIIRGYNKLQDFMIQKAGNDWGVPLTWVAIVLAILLIILLIMVMLIR